MKKGQESMNGGANPHGGVVGTPVHRAAGSSLHIHMQGYSSVAYWIYIQLHSSRETRTRTFGGPLWLDVFEGLRDHTTTILFSFGCNSLFSTPSCPSFGTYLRQRIPRGGRETKTGKHMVAFVLQALSP